MSSSGDEPEQIVIYCGDDGVTDAARDDARRRDCSEYISNVSRDSGIVSSERRTSQDYISEVYIQRPKCVALRKVESEPAIASTRDGQECVSERSASGGGSCCCILTVPDVCYCRMEIPSPTCVC